jgi:ribonucleoside-diphosphate reductase alpha chain
MAAERGAYVDQSQSLNLFQESPTIGKLSSMYMYAWEKGLKTTYYLRSRPATSINKVNVERKAEDAGNESTKAPAKIYDASEAVTCSLENPEACEACQ